MRQSRSQPPAGANIVGGEVAVPLYHGDAESGRRDPAGAGVADRPGADHLAYVSWSAHGPSIGRAWPRRIVKVVNQTGAGNPAGLDDADGLRRADAGAVSRISRRLMGQPTRQENWRSLAACRSADPDLFFPISSSGRSIAQAAEAKAICAGCPVRRECLAFALRTHQGHGVWGGLSEQERYPLWSAVLAGLERGQTAEIDTVRARDPR